MTARWIDIPYKCQCMKTEGILRITERDKNEDILEFMERVKEALGEEHHRLSPFCRISKAEYVKIPMGGDVVGGATGGSA